MLSRLLIFSDVSRRTPMMWGSLRPTDFESAKAKIRDLMKETPSDSHPVFSLNTRKKFRSLKRGDEIV